jgi:aspartokinase-like uncharacterized kinase
MGERPVIVKVGGSLFDLKGLGPQLAAWLGTLAPQPIVLVPGGGPFANVIRQFDVQHGLGEEASHRLALASLTLSARFLAAVVPGAITVDALGACSPLWKEGYIPILDPARMPIGKGDDDLPHSWETTSDSIAARIASVARARLLILLKSVSLPEQMGWGEAALRGYVDRQFAGQIDGSFEVRFINFRQLP